MKFHLGVRLPVVLDAVSQCKCNCSHNKTRKYKCPNGPSPLCWGLESPPQKIFAAALTSFGSCP